MGAGQLQRSNMAALYCIGLLFALNTQLAAAQVKAESYYVNIDPGPHKEAVLTVGDENSAFLTFSDNGFGALEIKQNGKKIITFDAQNSTLTAANQNLTGTIRADGNLYVNGTLFADDMDIDEENDLAQWTLIYMDMFHQGSAGWSFNETTPCGSPYKILGGHCKLSNAEVSKTYDKLPPHKSVRLQARYYMIDDWQEDNAYAKIEGTMVWTFQYTWCTQALLMLCPQSRSVCGKEDYPDKIGHMLDVSHPHSEDTVTITFGSSLEEDACKASYGVQGVSVWIR